MTVKTAMGDFGGSRTIDEVIGWMRASTDVSDAIICTDTAEAFDWVMDAFNARVENFTAKTCRDGEKGFIFLSQQPDGLKGEEAAEAAPWHLAGHHGAAGGARLSDRAAHRDDEGDMNGTRFAQAYIEVLGTMLRRTL